MRKVLAGLAVLPVVSSVTLAMGARPAAALTTLESYSITSVTSTVIVTRATGSSSDNTVSVTAELADAVWDSWGHRWVLGSVSESLTKSQSHGGGLWSAVATFERTAVPGARYMSRICVNPQQTCSGWRQITTATADHSVETGLPSVNSTRVEFNPTVTGLADTCNRIWQAPGVGCNPRMAGIFTIQWGNDTSYGHSLSSDPVEAARIGSATRMLFGRFDPNTTYHYRACYLPFMLNDRGVNPAGPSLMRCGQDRTFTPALAVTPPS